MKSAYEKLENVKLIHIVKIPKLMMKKQKVNKMVVHMAPLRMVTADKKMEMPTTRNRALNMKKTDVVIIDVDHHPHLLNDAVHQRRLVNHVEDEHLHVHHHRKAAVNHLQKYIDHRHHARSLDVVLEHLNLAQSMYA